MSAPVNLADLRTITDGDTEIERQLFEEFIRSFEKEIILLRSSCEANAAGSWHRHIHSLKGISLNLGAMKLGELCRSGQESVEESAEDKGKLVQAIEAEYGNVRSYLQEIMAA